MFRVCCGREMGALSAVESFSGYAVRYLKPELTQNWRVGRAALASPWGPAGWREERLTRDGAWAEEGLPVLRDKISRRERCVGHVSGVGLGCVSPRLTSTPLPLACPSTVSTRTPAWTATDRSPCLSIPCKASHFPPPPAPCPAPSPCETRGNWLAPLRHNKIAISKRITIELLPDGGFCPSVPGNLTLSGGRRYSIIRATWRLLRGESGFRGVRVPKMGMRLPTRVHPPPSPAGMPSDNSAPNTGRELPHPAPHPAFPASWAPGRGRLQGMVSPQRCPRERLPSRDPPRQERSPPRGGGAGGQRACPTQGAPNHAGLGGLERRTGARRADRYKKHDGEGPGCPPGCRAGRSWH